MNKFRLFLVLLAVGLCCIAGLAISGWATAIPTRAEVLFGPPSASLDRVQHWRLAWSLVENVDSLTLPVNPFGEEQSFEISGSEPALSVIDRLSAAGLIRNSAIFRDYMIYSGADTRIVPGSYTLSPTMTALEIAADIQNIEATGVLLRILPGWRIEEVAAALPLSGLSIDSAAFLEDVRQAPTGGVSAYWPANTTHEGLLFPDTYSLPRSISSESLISILTENFRTHINEDIQKGINDQGLSIYEAVTVASIVQREAIVYDEMPLIASVFLNRLQINMKLEADPTVQYSLGYSDDWGWWKAPLALSDLGVSSSYNTYQNQGLPPGPIANPGIEAILAVAFPEESGYYYFRAACDNSGRHRFSVTFDEHLTKGCP